MLQIQQVLSLEHLLLMVLVLVKTDCRGGAVFNSDVSVTGNTTFTEKIDANGGANWQHPIGETTPNHDIFSNLYS